MTLWAPAATSMIILLRASRPASIMHTQWDYSNRKLYSSAPFRLQSSLYLPWKKAWSMPTDLRLDNELHNHAKNHTIDRKPATALLPHSTISRSLWTMRGERYIHPYFRYSGYMDGLCFPTMYSAKDMLNLSNKNTPNRVLYQEQV